MADYSGVPAELGEVVGARELYEWFGYWPDFHDAEILSVQLNKLGHSRLTIHAWEMTNELDPNGFCILRRNVIVTFLLESITKLKLEDFYPQNVIYELTVRRNETGFELALDASCGLWGDLAAKGLEITLQPEQPDRMAVRSR